MNVDLRAVEPLGDHGGLEVGAASGVLILLSKRSVGDVRLGVGSRIRSATSVWGLICSTSWPRSFCPSAVWSLPSRSAVVAPSFDEGTFHFGARPAESSLAVFRWSRSNNDDVDEPREQR